MTILGFPVHLFFLVIVLSVVEILACGIYWLSGQYEGKKTEETYGIDDWYWTF